MTREQCAALVARLNSDPKMRELLNRPDPSCPQGATLAGLGVPYCLAGRDVPPPSLAAMARLSLVRSPFLSGADAASLMDAWRGLWAVTAAPEALSCLHGMEARCDAIRRVCSRTELPAETQARLCAEVEGAAFAEVDRMATALAGEYPGATAQDVADLLARMTADVSAAFGRVPRAREDDAPENPTTRPAALMATGWRTWRTWRRLLDWLTAGTAFLRRASA